MSVTAMQWMSTSEIAERTGVSARYLRDEIRDGKLQAMRFGTRGGRGTFRVPASVGEDYIRRMLGHLYQPSLARSAALLLCSLLMGDSFDLF